MTLQSPKLDDRTFQDIVDEAKQLIPQYCPEWTDHNLSDPGIALLEIFAWMTESIIYRLNQVPDVLYVKFLELLGVSLFPAAAARTDLTFWLSTPQPEPVRVRAGTQVGTLAGDDDEPVVFMTDIDLVIGQPVLNSCVTSGAATPNRYRPQWDELRFERGTVTCFSTLQPNDAIYFGFEESLARNVIRFDFVASTEGIGVNPDNPPWRWEVWAGESWVPARLYSDTTGGLNRDGSVILMVPARHEALTLGPERAYWVRCRLADPNPEQPMYQASPAITTLTCHGLGGTVPAHHGAQHMREVLGASDGRPGQVFRVRDAPVLDRRHDEYIEVAAPDETVTSWAEARSFAQSGPEDRHFTWDSASGEIRFGPRIRYPDGSTRQYGALPPRHGEIVVTGYRAGGGAKGNVGAGTLSVLHSSIPFVDHVTNLDPARGGVDPETVENAKERGAMTLRTGDRAVTAEDFERLTLEAAPSAARAMALPPSRPGGPIRVLIIPRVQREADQLSADDLSIPEDLYQRVRSYLDERRILGSAVEIGAPAYEGVSVVARVQVQPGRDPDLVRHRAAMMLYRFINPLVGGPDGKGWPFGLDLNVAQVFNLLAGVQGLRQVDEVLFFPVDLRTQRRSGTGQQQLVTQEGTLFLSYKHLVI
ncbi:MAG: putative baseplate assembly protein [Dehalococcoidia bacterium]